jgi:hypothetical protein
MKRLIMMICVAVSWVGICHAQNAAPYKANYSSKFTIADESWANKVLTVWKDYEDNMLDKHLAWFADTMSMAASNGQTVKGLQANLAAVKAYRATQKNLKVSIDAWVSLKSDKDENVVCVWGSEDFTDQNGQHMVNHLQEVWGFNKDGKISIILQYNRPGGTM